jgi:hypothetical protein
MVDILTASVEENVAVLLHVFERDISLENIETDRRAGMRPKTGSAQRSHSALIRAYRMGHCRFLQWCLGELHRQCPDEALSAATTRRMLDVSFGYADRVTEHRHRDLRARTRPMAAGAGGRADQTRTRDPRG